MRALTAQERDLIHRVADRLDGREGAQLRSDAENSTAIPANAEGSRILFDIAGYTRPPYRGQHPFGVEGRMTDRDGAELSVLLHADENGRLFELELIRWVGGDIIEPDWGTLELF